VICGEESVNKFIFDVDGTLTPSRQVINDEFAEFFDIFCRNNDVYLVTGSDKEKTIEQIGETIYNRCKRVYQCNGNDVWQGEDNIQTNEWTLPDLARTFLISCEYESDFSIRTGNHIEERPGMVNFSVVGRNADAEQRAAYVAFEEQNGERKKIADAFNTMFPDLSAKVGGETGIDISPRGADKSQIIKDFDTTKDKLWFFGDAIYEGGNDYPLAKVVKNHRQVTSWLQTKEYLEIFQDTGSAV
jgi:phosphomannomutase